MVSRPAPPSRLVRLAFPIVCTPPASAPNITDIESSPAPRSMESLFFNFAELIVSLPPSRSITHPPVKDSTADDPVLSLTFRLRVSAELLPIMT